MLAVSSVGAPRRPDAQYNLGYIWSISLVAALGGLLFGYDWVVIGGARYAAAAMSEIQSTLVNETERVRFRELVDCPYSIRSKCTARRLAGLQPGVTGATTAASFCPAFKSISPALYSLNFL